MTEADRLTEMAAEIKRLEADNEGLDDIILDQERRIVRLHIRIAELEAAHAMQRGTLAQPTPDEATTITHNVPPSAPPHGE